MRTRQNFIPNTSYVMIRAETSKVGVQSVFLPYSLSFCRPVTRRFGGSHRPGVTAIACSKNKPRRQTLPFKCFGNLECVTAPHLSCQTHLVVWRQSSYGSPQTPTPDRGPLKESTSNPRHWTLPGRGPWTPGLYPGRGPQTQALAATLSQ